MRKPLAIGVLGLLSIAALGVRAEAQIVAEMTPALIKEAIASGEKTAGKNEHFKTGCYRLLSTGGGMMETGMMRGCVSTPYSRVVAAAMEAKEKYKRFTEADVTPDMIEPVIIVHAFAHTDRRSPGVVSAESVIIKPKKSRDLDTVIRPTKSDAAEETYKNAMGGSWTGKSIVATFPIDALSEGNEIRFIYEGPACFQGSKLMPKPSADCGVKLGQPIKDLR